MLDGDCTFQTLDGDAFDIWWGAYLGMPEQILESGHLRARSAHSIIARRAEARAAHGWIMDTYLAAPPRLKNRHPCGESTDQAHRTETGLALTVRRVLLSVAPDSRTKAI